MYLVGHMVEFASVCRKEESHGIYQSLDQNFAMC